MAQENDSEKTYEVKDKRRVKADGTLREEPEPPEQTPSAPAEETAQAEAPAGAEPTREQEPVPPPNVYHLLEFVLGMLAEQAWQLMGIRLAPGQKEMARDMAQAKLAIDTMVFISEKLQTHLEEEDRKALRGMISDLQMNFVVQSGKT